MKELLCRIGLHIWEYPIESADGTKWANRGIHRYCNTCRLEQSHTIPFDKWVIDFRGIKQI